MEQLDRYIDAVPNLPPAPTVLPQLLVALNEVNIDLGKIVDLITYEPALTAEVLRVCNSAHFSGHAPADDLQEAISRLGFYEVYRVVAAVLGERTLGGPQLGYRLNTDELWKHSATTALATQIVARELGCEESPLFTAGLLHDIGKIILAEALVDSYDQVIREIEENQLSFVETETKLLGVQHAEVGARLLQRWKFPENLVGAVQFHHDPAASKEHWQSAALVHVGDAIAHFIGQAYGAQPFAFRGQSEALRILEISSNDIEKFMIQTVEGMAAVEYLFGKASRS